MTFLTKQMRRDNDYIRALLLEIEEQNSGLFLFPKTFDCDDKKWHHLQLLCDSGYLCRVNESAYRLTNSGHDFIESIRDPEIWKKVMDVVATAGSDTTLEIIKTIALHFLKKQISNITGVDL